MFSKNEIPSSRLLYSSYRAVRPADSGVSDNMNMNASPSTQASEVPHRWVTNPADQHAPRGANGDMSSGNAIPTSRLLYSIDEAVAQLGVGRTYLYQLIKHGKVRTVKLGRRTLVPHDELVRYVASLTRGTVGDGE